MVLFVLPVHSKRCVRKLSPLWAPHLRRLLRDYATRDIDKPEARPASEPESLHSCVLFLGLVGQASIRLCSGYQCGTLVKLQIDFVLLCVGVASNNNMKERNKWTLLYCETVIQPKDVLHVSGSSQTRQIKTTALTTTTRLVRCRRIRRSRVKMHTNVFPRAEIADTVCSLATV